MTATDEASGPIRQLSKTLEGASKQGVQDLSGWSRSGLILGDVFTNIGVAGRNAFGVIGVAAGAAGGAILALGGQLKVFAKDAEGLKFFSEETNVSIEKLERLGQIAGRVQVSPTAFNAGVKAFTANMEEIVDHSDKALRLQVDLTRSGVPWVYQRLQALSVEKDHNKQLEEGLKLIRQIRDPAMQARLSEKLFGTPDFGRIAREQPRLEQLLPFLDPANQPRMQAFSDQLAILDTRFANIKTAIMNEASPALTAWTEQFNKFLDENKGEIGAGIIQFFEGVKTATDVTIEEFKLIKPYLDQLNTILDKIGLGVAKPLAEPGTPERKKQDEEEAKAGGMLGVTGPAHRFLLRHHVVAPRDDEHIVPSENVEVKPESEATGTLAPWRRLLDYNRRQREAEQAEALRVEKAAGITRAPEPTETERAAASEQRKQEHFQRPAAVIAPEAAFPVQPPAGAAPSIIPPGAPAPIVIPPAAAASPEPKAAQPEAQAPGPSAPPAAPEAPVAPSFFQGVEEKAKEFWRGFWHSSLEEKPDEQRRPTLASLGVFPDAPAVAQGEKPPAREEKGEQPPPAAAPIVKASLELPPTIAEHMAGQQRVNGVPPGLIKLPPQPDARDRPPPSNDEPERAPGATPAEKKAEPQEQRADVMAWLQQNGIAADRARAPAAFPSEDGPEQERNVTNIYQQLAAPEPRLDQAMAQQQKMMVEGSAKLDINVRAPRGTEVAASTGGDLFKEVSMSRSNQMGVAADWTE